MPFLGLLTRCKDEPFIFEFCDYYLSEGVDKIIIIDDNSNNKSIYDKINNNDKIKIIYNSDNINNRKLASQVYKKIRKKFKWLIYCDVDEYICTKINSEKTIKHELKNKFRKVDCIKIPWVMMSSNNRDKNPDSLLKETIFRWDHNKKHPNNIYKFRCKYKKIEVKCIFKPRKFYNIKDHHPIKPKTKILVVDSINKKKRRLGPTYRKLRESKINNGILLCYHYRIISKENCLNKIKTNKWYKHRTLEELLSADYAEIKDETIKNKILKISEKKGN
jgi:hypothetical protein